MDDPCGIERLRDLADSAHARAPEVSAWTVGEHIEHCALAMLGIAGAMLDSRPPAPPRGLALWQRVILASGRIPRGKGRAPAAVVATGQPEPQALHAQLDEARRRTDALRAGAPGLWFRHFALGVMDRDRALRFLRVHNRHHERIVQDVLAASRVA